MRKPGCNIWSKSWARIILTTFMKNRMCGQLLKPPSNESWLKLYVDLITLDLSNICFWYWAVFDLYYICLWIWVVFVLKSILYLSLDLYYICPWIYIIFVFGSILYLSLDLGCICLCVNSICRRWQQSVRLPLSAILADLGHFLSFTLFASISLLATCWLCPASKQLHFQQDISCQTYREFQTEIQK